MCALGWPPHFLPELLWGTGQTTRKGGHVPVKGERICSELMEPLAETLRKTLDSLTARLNKVKDVVYFT